MSYQVLPDLSPEDFAFVPFSNLRRGLPGVVSIYAIESDDGYVKIGLTAYNPDQRLSSLQTSTPHNLRLVGSFLGTAEIERIIHQRLKKFHVRGEWFRVNVRPLFAEMAALQRGVRP